MESGLSDLPRCRDLDPVTVSHLSAAGDRMRVAAGELLFREGDAGDCSYLVLSARLDAHRSGRDVRESVEEGGLVGVLEVLSGESRIATVVATRATELLRVSAATLDGAPRHRARGRARFSAMDAIVEAAYAYSMEHLEGWVPDQA